MTKSNRLGTALTAVSLIAIAAGCSSPGSRIKSAAYGRVDINDVAVATRAQMALASNDLANAVPLAERAVEKAPNDASLRTLLGNCYLASGRFASAEAAYRDSLSLATEQPQVVLKLALVQIAQGKNDEAKSLLAQAQGLIDPADAGLALALAGDPQTAVAVLEPAARAVGADARTRQNLALAYALAGDWDQSRTVAAQDIPGDKLDARIEQWMALAKPARASDQVAALIGVQPVADPGQPVRLALNRSDAVQQAAAEPVAVPAPVAPPVEVAATEPVPAPQPEPVAASSVTIDLPPPPPFIAPEPAKLAEAQPALSPAAVKLTDSLPRLRRAAAARPASGKSRAVVQIGAYSSRDRVASAWGKVSGKYGSLKRYTPVTARFAGAQGTVYRLAVKGFATNAEANSLCNAIKRSGGSCFVRNVSGDAPVQFASRS